MCVVSSSSPTIQIRFSGDEPIAFFASQKDCSPAVDTETREEEKSDVVQSFNLDAILANVDAKRLDDHQEYLLRDLKRRTKELEAAADEQVREYAMHSIAHDLVSDLVESEGLSIAAANVSMRDNLKAFVQESLLARCSHADTQSQVTE